NIILPEGRARHTLAAALLRAVVVDLGALGIAGAGDGDDHLLAGDEVLHRDLAVERHDRGPAVVAAPADDLRQLVRHDLPLPLRLRQDVAVVRDLYLDLG